LSCNFLAPKQESKMDKQIRGVEGLIGKLRQAEVEFSYAPTEQGEVTPGNGKLV
jgi:hypothetical protein